MIDGKQLHGHIIANSDGKELSQVLYFNEKLRCFYDISGPLYNK